MASKSGLFKGKVKVKKEKKKGKNSSSSGSDSEDSEHELSYFVNDRVKLMKEVIKLLHPKKIKSMAPDFMKDMDITEINSILLEELLGISNKRLKKIFNGEHQDDESSSSESEEEQKIDVISLDDISDDEVDFASEPEADSSKKNKPKKKIKDEPKEEQSKITKHKKQSKETTEEPDENEKLMSVLELLELQARARAIRSQLALEAEKKKKEQETVTSTQVKNEDESDSDAVIIDTPRNDEIIISSSEDEETTKEKRTSKEKEVKLNDIDDDKHKPSTSTIQTSKRPGERKENMSPLISQKIDKAQKTTEELEIVNCDTNTLQDSKEVSQEQSKDITLEENNELTQGSKDGPVVSKDIKQEILKSLNESTSDDEIIEIEEISSCESENEVSTKQREIKIKEGNNDVQSNYEKVKDSPKKFTNLEITISNKSSDGTYQKKHKSSVEDVKASTSSSKCSPDPKRSKDKDKKKSKLAEQNEDDCTIHDKYSHVDEDTWSSSTSKMSTKRVSEEDLKEALKKKHKSNRKKSHGKSDSETDEIIINLEAADMID